MTSKASPPAKRKKLFASNEWHVRAILADTYSQEIPLVEVYISRLEEKIHISVIMQELCKLLPLIELQHLKRVRQYEIMICKTSDVGKRTLAEHLNELKLSTDAIALLCKNIKIQSVPALAPKLRWQYDVAQKHWPCKFHPDKNMESLYNGSVFSAAQKEFHAKMLQLLYKISNDLECGNPCGLCVDARNGAIVALANSRTSKYPMMHCPMVLVDFVARSQNGGAWNDKYEEEFMENSKETTITLKGIPKRYFEFVCNDEEDSKKYKFGAECVKCGIDKQIEMEKQIADNADNLSKYGPYLCTGYDVYLMQEPCLMCAMALVHSRVKRIFFAQRSENGALISCFKLHAVKELNHHYEVFECTFRQEDLSDDCTQR